MSIMTTIKDPTWMVSLFLENIDDLACIINQNLKIEWANKVANSYFNSEEHLSKSKFSKAQVDCLSHKLNSFQFIKAQFFSLDTHLCDFDHTWKIALIHTNPNLYLLIGNLSHKNESNTYAAALKDYYENIIAQMPELVYWKDANKTYLGCNDNCAKALGLKSRHDIVGMTDFDFNWPIERIQMLENHDKTVLEQQKQIDLVEKYKMPSGNANLHLDSHKSPLYLEGKLIGILGISIDITAQELMKNALKDARNKAIIASAAKSEFIANMSHDLRTPLTGVVGMAKDMMITAEQANDKLNTQSETSIKQSFQEVLETVQQDSEMLAQSADELVQLCNEILETVSLESGKSTEIVEAFNIRELVADNIKLLLPAAKHKKLDIISEIDEKVPTFLKGIRTYLDRSLLNLISNAIKFTKEGFVKVKVGLADDNKASYPYLLDDEVKIYVAIEDSGIGIPKDKFDEIFEHFSRLTSSYQGIYKGAGLGLYTVRQYATALHGTINVDSELGKGSTFTLNLPFTVADHADRVKKSVLSSKKKSTVDSKPNSVVNTDKDNAEPAPILVVEDSNIAAMALKSNLQRKYGVKSDIASDGAKALEMIQKHAYSLVLMDIGLPDMTGIEVTQAIRKLNISVPIAAVTGHAGNPEKCQEALNAGMQIVLNKPPAEEELDNLLQEYVTQVDAKQIASPLQNLDQKVIDWEGTLAACLNDEALAHEALEALANDLIKRKETVVKAYTQNDIETLCFELHNIKGGISYFKVPQLQTAVAAFYAPLEDKADKPLIKSLEKEYEAFIQAVDAYQEAWHKIKLR